MDSVTQQGIIDRLLDHFDNNTTDRATAERYIDITDYVDPARFARERDRVCAGLPVLIGHVSQLRTAGDFISDTVYGVPVLVARSADGAIRGFRNVCRHRGALLVNEPAGNRKAFLCPYHAWQYNSAGELTHVPDRERCFPSMALSDRGLLPVRAFERYGFIWVDLSDTDTATATDTATESTLFLDPLATDLDGYHLDRDQLYGTELLHANANWKLVVEAFLEVYHFKALHPQMKSYIFSHEHALLDPFGDHVRMIAPKREIREFRDRPREEWEVRPHATILYFVFPHTFLFVETRHTSTLQVRPIGPDRSEIRMMHVANERGVTEPDRLDVTIKALMQAMEEDVWVCESMQQGFPAGPHEVVFGRNEIGLQHFRDVLDRRLAG